MRTPSPFVKGGEKGGEAGPMATETGPDGKVEKLRPDPYQALKAKRPSMKRRLQASTASGS